MMFRAQNVQTDKLRDKVEKALLELVKDGTFKKLSEKYFETDVCILKAE